MHDFGAELLRIGQQLKNEWGGLIQFAASVIIVLAAVWSMMKRVGRGIGKGWRWVRGCDGASKPDFDDIEGA